MRGASAGRARIGIGAALLCWASALAAAAAPPGRFAGPDGRPLPFATDDEALAFLREGAVVASERAPGGVTGARKLMLERDGVRAHAIFRRVDREERHKVVDGRFAARVRDHYANEVAAYALARALGLDTVPPTVARSLGGEAGSLQLWVEGARTEGSYLKLPRTTMERARHALQVDQMKVFDNLIYNMDRNLGNSLTDADGRVWYVDHTLSFPCLSSLPDAGRVYRVSRGLWERLQQTPDPALVAALLPYLGRAEIDALLERRRRVVRQLSDRIDRDGPRLVVFDLATWARAAP